METRYRHIVPNHLPRDSLAAARGAAPPSSSSSKKKKRAAVRVACNACRTRKTACDGKRAQCTPCVRRGTECVFITEDAKETPGMALKRKNGDIQREMAGYRELVHYLQTAPEGDAHAAFMQLRQSPPDDISGVVRAIRALADTLDADGYGSASPEDAELEEMSYPSLSPVTTLTTESEAMWPPSQQQQQQMPGQPSWNMMPPVDNALGSAMETDSKPDPGTSFGETAAMNRFMESPFFIN